MKTTLKNIDGGTQCILGARCVAGMAFRKLARWMGFAIHWIGYYQKKKHNHYHQETKGIMRHVFGRWYSKGKSLLKHMNT